jgi:hypothetical protein
MHTVSVEEKETRCPPEPVQTPVAPGLVSGYGTNRLPHAPLSANVLSITVSLVAPDTVIPVPTGWPVAPNPGALALLLLWLLLSMNTQHDRVRVIPLIPPSGQSPSWGGGGSPTLWVFVSNPSMLLSNWELEMTNVPPEFVPEYPSPLVTTSSSKALWVSNREEHIMLVGTTGSSKSRSVFLPTLGVVAAEATHSVVVFDMKGELYAHSAEAFSSSGYHVRQFNLRSPRAGGDGSRWNPVAAVTHALRAGDTGRATQVAWAIAHALAFRSGDKAAAEMWPATSEATIASLILALAAGTPTGAAQRLGDLVALNPRLVHWRWPQETEQHLGSVYRCLVNPGPGATHLEDWVTRLLPPDHPAVVSKKASTAEATVAGSRARAGRRGSGSKWPESGGSEIMDPEGTPSEGVSSNGARLSAIPGQWP